MFLNNSAGLQHMNANLKQAQQQQTHPTLALNDYQQNALIMFQYLNQKQHQQEQLLKQDLFRQDELNAAQLLLNLSKSSSQMSFPNYPVNSSSIINYCNDNKTHISLRLESNTNDIKKPDEQSRKILKPHPKFRVKVK